MSAVAVGVDEVQAGRGAPMPQQPRLDVFELEGLGQQRIFVEVDLADGQVIGSTPVGVDLAEVLWRKNAGLDWLCRFEGVFLAIPFQT